MNKRELEGRTLKEKYKKKKKREFHRKIKKEVRM